MSYLAPGCGREISSDQGLAYLQAFLLFMQRDSRRLMTILLKIYNENMQSKGPQHSQTKIASYFLGLGLIVDSVLSGVDIPLEVDILDEHEVYDCVSLLAMTCSIMAGFLVNQRLTSLAIPLFHRNYRIQKRRNGRHSRWSVLALATFAKVRKVGRWSLMSSNAGTPNDPRIFMQNFWKRALRNITKAISKKRKFSTAIDRNTFTLTRDSKSKGVISTRYGHMLSRKRTNSLNYPPSPITTIHST